MICTGRGGRHGSGVFGSSSYSKTRAGSFRHFFQRSGLRLGFGRGSTQSAADPCGGDNLVFVLGFTATAGGSWLSRLCRSR